MIYNEVQNDGQQLSKEDAVWQYIIDHSAPTPAGHFIRFHVRDRKHWNSKVSARMRGIYRSCERDEEEKIRKMVDGFFVGRKINEKFNAQVSSIDREGTWVEKLALFTYRKCRNIIQKKKTSKDLEK